MGEYNDPHEASGAAVVAAVVESSDVESVDGSSVVETVAEASAVVEDVAESFVVAQSKIYS